MVIIALVFLREQPAVVERNIGKTADINSTYFCSYFKISSRKYCKEGFLFVIRVAEYPEQELG